jgi:hypothetical protein
LGLGANGRRSKSGTRCHEPQLKVKYREEILANARVIANRVSAEKTNLTKTRRQRVRDKKRKRIEQSQPDAEGRVETGGQSERLRACAGLRLRSSIFYFFCLQQTPSEALTHFGEFCRINDFAPDPEDDVFGLLHAS